MEELVFYLFSKIPGLLFYGRDITDDPRNHELDLVFWNKKSSLHFLDTFIIIECKNLKERASASQVSWFIKKISKTGLRTGIFISSQGVSGKPDKSAHREILDALTQHGISILTLNDLEIRSLSNSDMLVELLKDKYAKLIIKRRVV